MAAAPALSWPRGGLPGPADPPRCPVAPLMAGKGRVHLGQAAQTQAEPSTGRRLWATGPAGPGGVYGPLAGRSPARASSMAPALGIGRTNMPWAPLGLPSLHSGCGGRQGCTSPSRGRQPPPLSGDPTAGPTARNPDAHARRDPRSPLCGWRGAGGRQELGGRGRHEQGQGEQVFPRRGRGTCGSGGGASPAYPVLLSPPSHGGAGRWGELRHFVPGENRLFVEENMFMTPSGLKGKSQGRG